MSRESLNTILEADTVFTDRNNLDLRSLHDSSSHQFIVPAMNFSTLSSGILKKWTFAGTFNFALSDLLKFQIWRRDDSRFGYYIVNETRAEPKPTGYLNVYEIALPESPPVFVEDGDVVGIYLPEEGESRYSLAYVAGRGGYRFMEVNATGYLSAADCCRGRPLVVADIGNTLSYYTTGIYSGVQYVYTIKYMHAHFCPGYTY